MSDLPPAPRGVDPQTWGRLTPFRRRVYATLCEVPRGRVTTYAALAAAVGCRSPRAVGQALRANPLAPVVPCHRVIASSRRLGGFAGQTSGGAIERKRAMLRAEGVEFTDSGRLADEDRLVAW